MVRICFLIIKALKRFAQTTVRPDINFSYIKHWVDNSAQLFIKISHYNSQILRKENVSGFINYYWKSLTVTKSHYISILLISYTFLKYARSFHMILCHFFFLAQWRCLKIQFSYILLDGVLTQINYALQWKHQGWLQPYQLSVLSLASLKKKSNVVILFFDEVFFFSLCLVIALCALRLV